MQTCIINTVSILNITGKRLFFFFFWLCKELATVSSVIATLVIAPSQFKGCSGFPTWALELIIFQISICTTKIAQMNISHFIASLQYY